MVIAPPYVDETLSFVVPDHRRADFPDSHLLDQSPIDSLVTLRYIGAVCSAAKRSSYFLAVIEQGYRVEFVIKAVPSVHGNHRLS
jgi:hypothetical protein